MRRGLVLGTGLLGSTTSAAGATATARTAWQLRIDVQQPADVLLVLATGALALLLVRATGFGAAVVAAAAAPRSPRVRGIATALSPRLLRPVVIAVLGLGIGLSGAAAASASTTVAGSGPPVVAVSVGWAADGAAPAGVADPPEAVVSPGWVAPAPRTPTTAAADVHLVTSGGSTDQPDGTVAVRRGDCLWTLAARQLGDQAGDAQVREQWHRWWAANRATIGDDPDLLVPGTRLVVPATTAGPR